MTTQERYKIVIAIHKLQELFKDLIDPNSVNTPQRIQFTGNHYLMQIQDVLDHVKITEDKKEKKN